VRALADSLLAVLVVLIVLAVLGDEISRAVDALAVPLCAVLIAAALARLAWFYTSRW
jgi:hypothetical protein